MPATPARAASTRGVQREDVGLKGDLVDRFEDLRDLDGRRPDAAHRLDECAERIIGRLDAVLGIDHQRRNGGRALGVQARHRGHFLHRRRGLLEGGRLLGRSLRQRLG
jgi:hypothetical protein